MTVSPRSVPARSRRTIPVSATACLVSAAAFAMLAAAALPASTTSAMAQTPPTARTDDHRDRNGEANGAAGMQPGQVRMAGRYVMKPTANGFLRLDSQTGAVSLCIVKGEKVTCQSSADERAALEAEISRLARKNTELEKKLADASKSTAQRLREVLPSDKEMDKALSYAEQFMRRMMRIMREEDKKEPGNRI